MKKFELLSRASAFLVLNSKKNGNKFHVIGSAHVTHPFLYPQYFGEQSEWLKFVQEENVRCKLEWRDEKGDLVCDFRLKQKMWKHPSNKDLVVLHFDDDRKGEMAFERSMLEINGIQVTAATLHPNTSKNNNDNNAWIVQQGDSVKFLGNRLNDVLLTGTEHERQIPCQVDAQVLMVAGGQGNQIFSKPSKNNNGDAAAATLFLSHGMCGGPMLNEQGYCVGVLEGIVSANEPQLQHLSNSALSIGSTVVQDFIENFVEPQQPTNIGGDDDDADNDDSLFWKPRSLTQK